MKILITGGASGLGGILTRQLATRANDQIYFTYHNSSIKAKAIEKEFKNCSSIKCDFSDETEINTLLQIIETENFDVLINNAYVKIFDSKHFHKTASDDFTNSFQQNISSTIKITQKAIQIFRKKKFGKIVTILSSAIIGKPQIGWSLYVAEKNYLLSLNKSWAIENAKFNISSNAISPGFMLTDFHKDVDERIIEQIKDSNPTKELLDPKEIAKSVEFIIDASQQTNGINLIINAAENVT